MWAKINVRILIFTMLLHFCKSDNQNFENILKNEKKKKKKKPGDIILLHKHTINYNHMM